MAIFQIVRSPNGYYFVERRCWFSWRVVQKNDLLGKTYNIRHKVENFPATFCFSCVFDAERAIKEALSKKPPEYKVIKQY